MLEIEIPYWKHLRLEHLVMDSRLLLVTDDQTRAEIAARIRKLAGPLHIVLLSAYAPDQARAIAAQFDIELHLLNSEEPGAEQKAIYVSKLGAHNVVAIGSGADDGGMLYLAGLGVAVMSATGLSSEAMENADLTLGRIEDALDLLLHPQELVAALRG
jgi:soluble P-type ATPase